MFKTINLEYLLFALVRLKITVPLQKRLANKSVQNSSDSGKHSSCGWIKGRAEVPE